MKNLQLSIEQMAPSRGVTPQVITEQFNWRLNKQLKPEQNYITIIDIDEPVWWNRPASSNILVKQEADGLYSYNLPFLGNRADFKTGYNLLLNKNSIPIANHIKINPNWTPEQLEALSKMITNAVYAALLELGVNAEKLSFNHNDILYEGKKFMGYEQLTSNGVFSEDIVITLEYSPEKEIFQRLTGKYALTRGITGIIEETQCFTKQQFIEKLLEKIIAFTKTLA
jgi:hypothetical protein